MGIIRSIKKVTNPLTHSLDLENKVAQIEEIKSNIEKVSLDNQQKACQLYGSRKKSLSLLQRLDKYVHNVDYCPEAIIKGCDRALLSMKNIKEAADFEASELSNGTFQNDKTAFAGAAGVVAGGLTATVGPTAAMAIATTFGTASTGTAIASLGGAAATNAALAWLGGGAVAAGGAGMAGGATFLAILGPVGWSIAGLTLVGSTLFSRKRNNKEIQKVQEEIDKLQKIMGSLNSAKDRLDSIIAKTEQYNDFITPDKYQSEINNYQDDSFPKKMLFTTVDHAKLIGKLSSEAVYPSND